MKREFSHYSPADFHHSPLILFYEMTRACNLKCAHCRAEAQPHRHPAELSPPLGRQLIDQLTDFPRPPLLVLTGGDPFKRPDLFDAINYARGKGLQVALTPSATALVTDPAIEQLKTAGLHRLAMSIDGADAATHDGFRGVPGSFARTLHIIRQARAVGLPVQVNTTIARHNVHMVDDIAALLATLDIVMWSVFFLVPTGRARANQRISATQCEGIFEQLYALSGRQSFTIKTTEAPHYRRFLALRAPDRANGSMGMIGTNDGKGVMFVSHIGEIYPSGFLPVRCGSFPRDSVVDVYQNDALFRRLRDPLALHGKCRMCEFREVCGGSRARAYALTGDPMAAEPDCQYTPTAYKEAVQQC